MSLARRPRDGFDPDAARNYQQWAGRFGQGFDGFQGAMEALWWRLRRHTGQPLAKVVLVAKGSGSAQRRGRNMNRR